MKIFLQELKLGRKSLIIWTASIIGTLLICIWMFPQMKSELGPDGSLFENFGAFTAAFGMDRLNFGTMIGFYGIECGNILGMGGGMFAALLGISMLAKEEKDRTAEFLFTHPVSRLRVLNEKLAAVMAQIILLNVTVTLFSVLGILSVGETVPFRELLLMHAAYLILQIEIAAFCYCVSAYLKRGNVGAGIGFALLLYFINIIANISADVKFLKYVTPYAYCEAADIVNDKALNSTFIILGFAYAAAALAVGYRKYLHKDIAA